MIHEHPLNDRSVIVRLPFVALLMVMLNLVLSTHAAAELRPFEDVTDTVGIKGMVGYHSAWGDFNNDGWEDLHDGGLWVNERGKKFSRFNGKGPSGHGISSISFLDESARACSSASICSRTPSSHPIWSNSSR